MKSENITGWHFQDKAISSLFASHFRRLFLDHHLVGLEVEIRGPECEVTDCDPYECICHDCPVCDGCHNPCQMVDCHFPYPIFCQHCDDYDEEEREGTLICSHFSRKSDRWFCTLQDEPIDICDSCREESLPCEVCSETRCERCNPRDFCEGCDRELVLSSAYESRFRPLFQYDGEHLRSEDLKRVLHLAKRKVLYVYQDGAHPEIATIPVPLRELPGVFSWILEGVEDLDGDISPFYGCGGHQTFIILKGGRFVPFPPMVIRNIIQLVRYYLPALLWLSCIYGSHKRGNYRDIPPPGWQIVDNHKYSAIHPKWDYAFHNKFPGMVEFRYPDGSEYVNLIHLTAILNAAIILKATNLATKGVVGITQEHFNNVKDAVNQFYAYSCFVEKESWCKNLVSEFEEYVYSDCILLGYDISPSVWDLMKEPRWADSRRRDICAVLSV